MVVIQTQVDHAAATVLAHVTRKTLRRNRSSPVRALAWFVVALEGFLTVNYLRGGFGGWLPNTVMGLFMLGCLLLEDRISGAVILRKVPPEEREVNITFQENNCYVCRTQNGEHWHLYDQIRAAAETKDSFVLLTAPSEGQVFSKTSFTWGTAEEFRALIEKKTGLRFWKV